jgi:hypothetical protein
LASHPTDCVDNTWREYATTRATQPALTSPDASYAIVQDGVIRIPFNRAVIVIRYHTLTEKLSIVNVASVMTPTAIATTPPIKLGLARQERSVYL